jgi:hypothetical protein
MHDAQKKKLCTKIGRHVFRTNMKFLPGNDQVQGRFLTFNKSCWVDASKFSLTCLKPAIKILAISGVNPVPGTFWSIGGVVINKCDADEGR